jgi:hypothetical protein
LNGPIDSKGRHPGRKPALKRLVDVEPTAKDGIHLRAIGMGGDVSNIVIVGLPVHRLESGINARLGKEGQADIFAALDASQWNGFFQYFYGPKLMIPCLIASAVWFLTRSKSIFLPEPELHPREKCPG